MEVMETVDRGVELTLDQRKQRNFKNYYFYVELLFYVLQGIYVAGLQVYIVYYTTNVFKLDYAAIATVTALSGLPTYLKMFTGLLSDRVPVGKFGRRKPYLIMGGILFIPAFIVLSTISTYSVIWLSAIILCNICFVIVDGTADALTVDITPDEHTSKMQGFANGGRYVGMAIGVALASALPGIVGWHVVAIFLGVAAAGQAFVTLLFKELPEAKEKEKLIPIKSAIKIGFGNRGAWLGLLFAVFFMGAMGMAIMIGPVVMKNTNSAVFGMATMTQYIAVAAGAFVVGQLVEKIGGLTNRNLAILFVAIWVLMCPWLLVNGNWDNTFMVIFAQAAMGFARGAVSVITYAVLMRLCSESIEGFMFSIFTSVMNLGLHMVSPKIIAYFGETLGMGMVPAMFTMMPMMLIGMLLIPTINKSVEERRAKEAAVSQAV
ncbi:MFS transporter [Faecalispora jeddahensis]|uniref:MFS transporter n=1 Tax=Faecalispora jeddahensis TaxID=1414721 RepID=UPI0004B248BB|nr:MFS transporter [Faecalispora jeddahensis]